MNDLERQIRQIVDRRADAIEPFDQSALVEARRPRSRWVVVAAAGVAVAVIAGWALWRTTDAHDPDVRTSPANADVVSGTCRSPYGEGPRSGTSKQYGTIRRIQVQLDQCATQVFFVTGPGRWNVHYGAGGSVLLVDLDGAGANSSGAVTDHQTIATPSPVRAIDRVRSRNDAEKPGTVWSLRLDRRRAFTARPATLDGDQGFVVEIAAPLPAPLRCEAGDSGLVVTIPDGWTVEMAHGSCVQMSPEPFFLGTGEGTGERAAIHLLPNLTGTVEPAFLFNGFSLLTAPAAVLSTTTTTVNGRPATVTELVQPTASVLDPAGTREYRVVILFSRTVALQISTLSDSGFDYDHDKTIVDAIAQSVTPG